MNVSSSSSKLSIGGGRHARVSKLSIGGGYRASKPSIGGGRGGLRSRRLRSPRPLSLSLCSPPARSGWPIPRAWWRTGTVSCLELYLVSGIWWRTGSLPCLEWSPARWHTLCRGAALFNSQTHPSSILQPSEHPSPAATLKSSQASLVATLPSPQMATHWSRRADPVELVPKPPGHDTHSLAPSSIWYE